jgi:hypothetical protein
MPSKVINLTPRINFADFTRSYQAIKKKPLSAFDYQNPLLQNQPPTP